MSKMRCVILIVMIFSVLLFPTNFVFSLDESEVSVYGLKNVYKVKEIINFEMKFPVVCGKNIFAVEDVKSGNRIWEKEVDFGCEYENEFIDRIHTQFFTTEHARPGGTEIHPDPAITSNEGTFRFIYESQQIKKEWQYQVFEKIPLHLDSEAHLRLGLLMSFYIALPLILYRDEIKEKFRK